MVSAPKKALKIKRVIKTAARLHARVRVSGGRGSGRSTFSPLEGESPLVILRVQIIGCSDLVGKDKHGSSDPYVTVQAN
jgi:phosphatidylserine decarboxylase